jgi:hypothetical protein
LACYGPQGLKPIFEKLSYRSGNPLRHPKTNARPEFLLELLPRTTQATVDFPGAFGAGKPAPLQNKLVLLRARPSFVTHPILN